MNASWLSRVKRLFAKTYIRKGLRVTRVGFLTFGIFSSGYQMGLAKYAEDPQEMDRQLMLQIVRSSVSTEPRGNRESNDSENNDLILKKDTKEYQAVQKVSSRVLKAAKRYCEMQLQEKEDMFTKLQGKYKAIEADANMDLQKKSARIYELTQQAEEIRGEAQRWTNVKRQLKGHWHCIVINSDSINAFVTNACPRRVFVNKGLFQVNPTEDELAMVLSHELSHLMLHHNETKTTISAYLAVFQLVLLTLIDPTGLGTFFIDICIGNLADYLSAVNSRACESEADELGVKILSLACYNVTRGTRIFEKFGLLEKHAKTGWFATHPSSDERWNTLQQLIDSEEMRGGKYEGNCQNLKRLFFSTFVK